MVIIQFYSSSSHMGQDSLFLALSPPSLTPLNQFTGDQACMRVRASLQASERVSACVHVHACTLAGTQASCLRACASVRVGERVSAGRWMQKCE